MPVVFSAAARHAYCSSLLNKASSVSMIFEGQSQELAQPAWLRQSPTENDNHADCNMGRTTPTLAVAFLLCGTTRKSTIPVKLVNIGSAGY